MKKKNTKLPTIQEGMTEEEKNAVRWARLEARTGLKFTEKEKQKNERV